MSPRPSIFGARIFASLALLCCLFLGTAAAQAEEFRPALTIPIPGVHFSNLEVKSDSGYVDIPWIAQYISGIYRYGISIAGIVAAVTMVIGGFQYMAGKPAEGKERIRRSLIGVVMVFGSYIILNTINPDLVTLGNIRIRTVPRLEFEADQLMTVTTTNTTGDVTASARRITLTGGSYKPIFSSCPYSPAGNPKDRRAQFYERVANGGFITAQNTRSRVQQIAELSILCGVQLGSCGQTAGALQSLAQTTGSSRNSDPCFYLNGDLPNKKGGDCVRKWGRTKKEIPSKISSLSYGYRCESYEKQHPGTWDAYKKPDCVRSAGEAQKKVADIFKAESAAGRIPAGWPDEWLTSLEPGDYVVIYTGNEDLSGRHAVTFLGWTSDGWMQTVSGNAGKDTAVTAYCVRSSCSTMVPTVGIHSTLP
jgi:hypothetical protein